MAIQPGTYNFTLQRRSDHTIPLLFKDGNDAAINLTGYTVEAQVWEETRTQNMQILQQLILIVLLVLFL